MCGYDVRMKMTDANKPTLKTVKALIPIGTPTFKTGAKSPWNLRSLVRYVFMNVPGSELVDFSKEHTKDSSMPCVRAIQKWSAHDGGWHEIRKQNAWVPDHVQRTYDLGSRWLSVRMHGKVQSEYNKLMDSADLMNLQSLLGVTAYKLQSLMEQVSHAEEEGQYAGSPSMWRDVRAAYNQFNYCMSRNKVREANLAMQDLEVALNRHESDESLWAEIREHIAIHSRLVEAEAKRLAHAGEFISAAEAIQLGSEQLNLLGQSIRECVDDETADLIFATYEQKTQAE